MATPPTPIEPATLPLPTPISTISAPRSIGLLDDGPVASLELQPASAIVDATTEAARTRRCDFMALLPATRLKDQSADPASVQGRPSRTYHSPEPFDLHLPTQHQQGRVSKSERSARGASRLIPGRIRAKLIIGLARATAAATGRCAPMTVFVASLRNAGWKGALTRRNGGLACVALRSYCRCWPSPLYSRAEAEAEGTVPTAISPGQPIAARRRMARSRRP